MRNSSYFFTIFLIFCGLLLFSNQTLAVSEQSQTVRDRLVIAAHGGGTDVLAGTLAALAMTAPEEIDFIEVDVTGTADNELIVSQSADLGIFTDAATIFPEKRDDAGRYPASAFTLFELRQLRKISNEGSLAKMPIASFEEYLSLLRYLEVKLNKTIALAVNLIDPSGLRSNGFDMSSRTLGLLKEYGYGQPDHRVILQSMDSDELQRLKKELLPAYMLEIPLYQRLARQEELYRGHLEPAMKDQSWMFTRIGVRMVSSYANGIIIDADSLHDMSGNLLDPAFIASLKENGLGLLVYNLPDIADEPLEFASDYRSLLSYYFDQLDADGIITNRIGESLNYFKPTEPGLPLLPLKSPFIDQP